MSVYDTDPYWIEDKRVADLRSAHPRQQTSRCCATCKHSWPWYGGEMGCTVFQPNALSERYPKHDDTHPEYVCDLWELRPL